MDKDKQIVLIVGLMVLALVLLPYLNLDLFAAYGTEESLKYQRYDSGTCEIFIMGDDGLEHSYSINVTSYPFENSIYLKFDGRPQLPPTFAKREFGSGGNQCTRFGLSNRDWNDMWKLINNGVVEGEIEGCTSSGASDPAPYDGINSYKCNAFCKPNQAVCVSNSSLSKCSSDGEVIERETCPRGCENNACIPAENVLSITTNKQNYLQGEDITVTGTFISSGTPVVGTPVIAQLLKGGSVHDEISENSAGQPYVTDINGNVTFVFLKPTVAGETTVKLIVQSYLGRSYEKPKSIQIQGKEINYNVSTYSYTQYSSKNITFNVKMTDSKGIEILPSQITKLKAVSSLTQGTIKSEEVIYKGFGLYEINSRVEGSGKFVGKLAFDFEGFPQSSPIITIDVRSMGVSIDTSKISPGAYLNETKNYTISITDPGGLKLDPDNLWIIVALPDGTTVKNINFSDIKKVSEGVYQFSYTFTQVEKHTFDIYADYSNYARGSARATVAISGAGDDFGPGPGFGFGNLPYFLYAGIAIVAIWLLIYRKENKGKIKNWLNRNKEGAIVGGIIGGIISYLAINGGTTFTFLMDMISIITVIFSDATWSIYAVGVVVGTVGGALIDSWYKPGR